MGNQSERELNPLFADEKFQHDLTYFNYHTKKLPKELLSYSQKQPILKTLLDSPLRPDSPTSLQEEINQQLKTLHRRTSQFPNLLTLNNWNLLLITSSIGRFADQNLVSPTHLDYRTLLPLRTMNQFGYLKEEKEAFFSEWKIKLSMFLLDDRTWPKIVNQVISPRQFFNYLLNNYYFEPAGQSLFANYYQPEKIEQIDLEIAPPLEDGQNLPLLLNSLALSHDLFHQPFASVLKKDLTQEKATVDRLSQQTRLWGDLWQKHQEQKVQILTHKLRSFQEKIGNF